MNTRFLLKLFDPGFILKTAFILLLFSLILLGEIFLIQFVSEYWGRYFTLALAAATGLAGLFLCYRDISSIIALIKAKAADGEFPGKEMSSLAGAFVGALFLIFPGFITDILGIISFLPIVRNLYGKAVTVNKSDLMHELYEYMKVYD